MATPLVKKLKRVEAGSTEQQKAAGVKITPQPEPTSPAWKSTAGSKPFDYVGNAPNAPLPQSKMTPTLPVQPQQPQVQQPIQQQGVMDRLRTLPQRAKEAGVSETIRRGLDVGLPETPGQTPSNFEMMAAVLPIPARALGVSGVSGKAVSGLEAKVGAKAVTNAASKFSSTGEKVLAGASKEVAKDIVAQGGKFNTKKTKLVLDVVGNFVKNNKLVSAGVIIGIIGKTLTGESAIQKEITDFIQKTNVITLKLAGSMPEEAEQMAAMVKDIQDGMDKFTPYIPLIGKGIESNKIQDYTRMLNEISTKYDTKKAENEKFAADVEQKLRLGIEVSPEDIAKAAMINPKGDAEKRLIAQAQIDKNKQSVEEQNKIVTKMIGMSDQDIVSNPEVLIAVNQAMTNPDLENSLLVKIYTEAARRIQESTALMEERAFDELQMQRQQEFQMQMELQRQQAEDRRLAQRQSFEAGQPEGGSSNLYLGGSW